MLQHMKLFYGSIEELVVQLHHAPTGSMFFAMNPDCYLIAKRDDSYLDILRNPASTVYVDGAGIMMGQRWTRSAVASERIPTTDLFPALYNFETQLSR